MEKPIKTFDDCLNLPLKDYGCLPDRITAVYVIYASPDIAIYIGATSNLRSRVMDHYRRFSKIKCMRLAWFPLPVEFHKETERELIKIYVPPSNVIHKPGGKAERWIHPGYTWHLRRFIREQRALI